MLDAGVAAAERRGLKVSIAVVDGGGYLVGLLKMDGAPLLSPDIAQGKAVASAVFNAPSLDLSKRWAPGSPIPTAVSARLGGRFVPHQGALPIRDGDAAIGAVGVSGAASDQDEAVAADAIAARPVAA
jgi:uncharacterized protein GlcG (DUF336 family)